MAIAAGRLRVADALGFVLAAPADSHPVVYSSAAPEAVAEIQRQLGRDAAGEIVERFLGELAHELIAAGVTRFVVAGGETSGAVAAALGARALRIGPEIDPGVPWTQASTGGKPIALALKSGNFGGDDFSAKAWRRLG